MRFAYLCCDFGIPIPGTSGSSVHVRETVSALRRLGHAVKVFSPAVPDTDGGADEGAFQPAPFQGFAAETVRLLAREPALQETHLRTEWRALSYAEHVQRTLFETLRAYRPDVIYERYALFSYAGVETARRLGCPLVLEVNAPLRLEQARHRELVLTQTAEALERRILAAADALTVVSTDLKAYAGRLGVAPERVLVLPNGVDPARFHPGRSGQAVRARYGLDGKWVVGFVGSLKPWHDLDTLLGAMRMLAAWDGSAHLLVVGEGPRLEALRRAGGSRITCVGAVGHERVPEHMAAMDVVVVPYGANAEAYFSPLKLFEAMAMAKPVVAARTGQAAEVIAHAETGLFYEPGDATGLAAALWAIRQMSDGGAHLGTAARRQVVGAHTWERNARRIVEVAQSLLTEVPQAS